MVRKILFVSCVAMLAAAVLAPATAQANVPIFTFGFTDLDGDYNAGTNVFTANATTLFGGTSGDVTRNVAPGGTADYNAGFFPHANADFNLTMTLSSITATTASGTGSFLITDADGETISGNMTGTWSKVGGSAQFIGTMSNIQFSNAAGTFDGPSGGSFSSNFTGSPFTGFITQLSLPDNWFSGGDFSDANSQAQGQVIPAPTALLLGVLGLASVRGLRRRLA